MLEELGDPDGIVDVGLAAGDLGDVAGVGRIHVTASFRT